MCLELLHRHLHPGYRFLDAGTSTGILMIAVARLGAASVAGFDRHENVCDIARTNLKEDGIPPPRAVVIAAESPKPFRGLSTSLPSISCRGSSSACFMRRPP